MGSDLAVKFSQPVINQFAKVAPEYSKEYNNAKKFVLEDNIDTDENKNEGGYNKIRNIPVNAASNIIEK